MTQEEKQLLFRDLSARVPYGVIVEHTCIPENNGYSCELTPVGLSLLQDDNWEVKPYLRPMSSMTEEELKELNEKYGNIAYFFIQEPPYYHGLQAQHSDIGSIEISEFSEIYDWLNAHHFDYRGLIPMGLALEAPEDMYKEEH